MRITTQGDYALRCILNIARNSTRLPVAIRRIAEDEGLPIDYIEQLLMKLRRNKLIKSVRGVKGGYLLDKNPEAITVKDVVGAVEGEAFSLICDQRESRAKSRGARKKNGGVKKCTNGSRCVLKGVWLGLKNEIEVYLGKQNLAKLLTMGG